LGEKGQRIRELTSAVQKRFGFPEGSVEMFAERVHNRGLSAMAQAESLKFKLLGGLQVCNIILHNLTIEQSIDRDREDGLDFSSPLGFGFPTFV
jgi:ribosomal protein S3